MGNEDSKSSLPPLQPDVKSQVAKQNETPIPRANVADQEQSRLMLEHLSKPGRSSKPKKSKPPTIKEEKDLIKELQADYNSREPDAMDEDLKGVDDYADFIEFLKKPKTEIIRTLEFICMWMNANEEELGDEAVRVIDERLQSHAKKSQVFFVVAVQKRMESLVRIMEASDLMETRLLDPANIWAMPIDELRKTLELMEKKTELILRQVVVLIEQAGGFPKKLHDDSKLPALIQDGSKVFDDPTKRGTITTRLDQLLKKKRER
jgi:hypothetical protein